MLQNCLPFPIGNKYSILFLFVAIFAFHSSYSQNAIVTENLNAGVDASVWDLTQNGDGTYGDYTILGYATDISVNKGNAITFKINVGGASKDFNITIYRIGYYGGKGARLIADLGTFTGIDQAACFFDNATKITDCGNWTNTTSWTVPATAVSGYYIAKLTRPAADGGGSSHIAFVVRDDASTSKLFFKASDATWQAYNSYGGASLYVGGDASTHFHATKVSYNRPFITRGGQGGGGYSEDWLMNSEYPMIRFLEANGFDISYTTDLDIARTSPNPILNHKVFLSVGHDEYWSKPERDNVEAARAAGVHLAFFSGNEVYWKTRWEDSEDGTGTPFRTMVCYKEGALPTPAENPCGDKCDVSTDTWTGLWRDGCGYPGVVDACKPENALSGQISWDGNTGTMLVPDTYKSLRFWRNTPVAALPAGGTATMTAGTLGYEWDWEQYPNSYPAGRVTMSNTLFDGHVHKLSLYRDQVSKALVFGAGTVQWAWGLDANHDLNQQGGGGPANLSMQQATINLLADMGVQPDPTAVLEPGLALAIGSTDVTPPSTVITTPVNGAQIPQSIPYIISGTATDVGGIVAGVDVSVDGGLTWQPATGTNNWTFSWTPTTIGNVTILSRAYDDMGNLELPSGSEGSPNVVNVNVVSTVPICPCSIFSPTPPPVYTEGNDNSPLSLGVKFKAELDGTITAIRFYKTPGDDALDHSVQLWSIGGTLLGQADIFGALPTGWNEATLALPIAITANTVYVAAYYNSSGVYPYTHGIFTNPVIKGPLTAISTTDPTGNNPNPGNGAYNYNGFTAAPSFPNESSNASSYWVDVVYNNGADIIPPTVISNYPADGETDISINSSISATFSEAIDPTTVNGATIELDDNLGNVIPTTISYTASSHAVSIIPQTVLTYATTYTVHILGGGTDPRIKDISGNALAADYTWSFTTTSPPAIPPDDGAGGPVLIISDANNPYSRYQVEILRAQGYTEFKAVDITEVRSNSAILNDYDVILLGQIVVTASDVALLSTWVNAGGTLIAQRPGALLLPLMGVVDNGNLSEGYLLVNTAAGLPGAGIVNQTIQYHGTADMYSMLAGTSSLATLYSSANAATAFAAITSKTVGTKGGKAIAFAFDLASSIVYTRQGNPSWAGLHRDGQTGPIRSDNLFYPSYVDFSKIQIPQADEQQHLLTNILLLNNLHRKPLPHLWILPRGLKAAVVMTGDDHNLNLYPGSSGTAGRFNEYMTLGPNTPQDVADWNAIRGTSFVYNNIAIPDDSVAYYQQQGFEIGLHPTTNCLDYTPASLGSAFSTQLSALAVQLPSLTKPESNRTHCMPWSDWATQAKVENSFGIRFDVNYYFWPRTWVQNRPGMFTGSGMPMRFADLDGSLIDVYQAPTQIPDESGLDITTNINTLLDNAINLGYYGAFVMNMHTDTAIHTGSDKIIASALARNIPVVSAKQMLDWLDSRNNTIFNNMAWDSVNKELSFDLLTSAHNLQAMVPFKSFDGSLIRVTENGTDITYTVQTIKGIQYGFFPASSNSYVAYYSTTPLPVTLINFTVNKQGNDAQLNWSTTMEENNMGFEIQRSTVESGWKVLGFVAGAGNSQTVKDYKYLDKNLPDGTYYYRLRQIDNDGHSQVSKIEQVTFGSDLSLMLMQNRPNPFNNNTTVNIVIPKGGQVQLTLYDQLGRPVRQLMNEFKSPGTYSIQVNRNGLSSGTYYYRMNAQGQTIVKKMTIL